MDATHKESNIIDENQSLTVIKEMIAVSRIKLRQDGILFIVWGWVLFYVSFWAIAKNLISVNPNIT